jgi:AcrR family transcriptional regulator
MSPEARREVIVEAAVELILETGHSGCSLEQVAARAGISKPLIYKYFPRREVLLKAILDREFKALQGRGLDGIPDRVPAENVIRGTVEQALRYYHDHGPILRLLSAEPAIAAATRSANQSSRSSATDYFVNRLESEYDVPRDVAVIAVTMVVNAPIHSMAYLRRQEVDIDRTIEVWTEFILGGWRALQERYGSDE